MGAGTRRLRAHRDTARKAYGRLRDEGVRETFRRGLRRAYDHFDVAELDFPLLPGDVADSRSLVLAPGRLWSGDRPLRVGWVCTPPAAGSGGHTTMFRMVKALEDAGHQCTVLLYDRHRGNTAEQAGVIAAAWPWVRARVRSADEGLGDLDVVVATSWESAHVIAVRGHEPVHRAYFIQDFEPLFTPAGSVSALAADSYRFGFANIALGEMVHSHLARLGVPDTTVPFSCDTTVYGRSGDGERRGIVFHARPGAARRGHRLAVLALREFHRAHPEEEIHVYGTSAGDLGVPVTDHGRLTPTELNELYNRAVAGIALSFTNISLVAEEMLAAGCIPVVNDCADARADLVNEYVAWAPPTPSGVAGALSAEVLRASSGRSAAAAASVRLDNWSHAGKQVVELLENLARGPQQDAVSASA